LLSPRFIPTEGSKGRSGGIHLPTTEARSLNSVIPSEAEESLYAARIATMPPRQSNFPPEL